MNSIILVDDEKMVLGNLVESIDWKSEGFNFLSSFSSALQALEFMKNNKVDVVITDIKMPGMDGIEFAKTIQKDFPDTLVIVLSAYRDFEYARQCMTYGVIDYILKPITFSKMKTALSNAKNKLNHNIMGNDSIIAKKRKIFYDVLRGDITDVSQIVKTFKDVNIFIDSEKSKFVLFRVKAVDLSNFLKTTWSHSTQQFYNAFSNVLVIEESNIAEARQGYDYIDLFLIITSTEEDVFLKNLYAVFSRISNRCFDILSLEVDIEILNIYNKIDEFIGAENKTATEITHINQVISFITNGKILEAQDKIEEKFRYNLQSLKYYKEYLQGFIIELSKIVDISVENSENLFSVRTEYTSIDEIKHQIFSIIDYSYGVIYIKPDTQQQLVENAKIYIKENYHEDLLLSNIAKAVFVSESHLSRVFKQRTGESIVDYINRVRLTHAKEMLLSTNLSIDDICWKCGYKSKNLFYKYFKLMYQVPPNKYRTDASDRKDI